MSIMKYTTNDANKFLKSINLNISRELFDINDLTFGLNVEAEHGSRDALTNVTNDNLIITGKIALAHLLEFPDYYRRLKVLETNAELYWKNRPRKRECRYKLIK